MVVEIEDIFAAGQADVILTVEGTIVDPGTSVIADQAVISTLGSIGTQAQPLNTGLNSLILEISGNGDLFLYNDSANLTLQDVVLANGNIDITAKGNLFAQKVLLKTDWDTTGATPEANQIILRTAEGSGGTITVGEITGGTYASTEEEAALIRLDLLNTLLAQIDLTDPSATGIPKALTDPLTDEDGIPILDEEGEPIIVVHLELTEAEELAVIVANALEASVDPLILYEGDFVDLDGLPPITGHVAFILYTQLLDLLGIAYQASFVDDGTPGWATLAKERIFAETTGLLAMTKGLSSQGKVTLQSDNAIVNGAGAGVSIVADSVTLLAKSSISGLTMAVNTIENALSSQRGSVSLFDVDGFGELTPGLEMITASAGPLSVTAQAGFIVGNAFSRGPQAALSLTSAKYNLFVKETGSSLISEGDISLTAAGDVIVTGHVQADAKAWFDAGRYLSTFGQSALC